MEGSFRPPWVNCGGGEVAQERAGFARVRSREVVAGRGSGRVVSGGRKDPQWRQSAWERNCWLGGKAALSSNGSGGKAQWTAVCGESTSRKSSLKFRH